VRPAAGPSKPAAATATELVGLLFAASVLLRRLCLSFRAVLRYTPPLISGPVWVVVRKSLLEQVIAEVLVLLGGGLLLVAVVLIGFARQFDALLESLLFKLLPRAPIRLCKVEGGHAACA
jgi:hypothetical protein